jgi:hypothetical protein
VTNLNNEALEMSSDDLDQVSGGNIINRIVEAYLAAVGKNLMDAIHRPAPKQTMTLHIR